MSKLTVLYDACVLYPAPLRDFVMHLALTDVIRAKWSATIHEEWIRNVLKARPDLKRSQLERTRKLMDAHVPDCLVEGYEALIDTLMLPDPNDRHVLAAAIVGQVDVILTFNLKDFPQSALSPHNIVAQHPDVYLSQLIEDAPEAVYTAAQRQRASLKNPPKNREEYLQIIERQGLPMTAAKLRENMRRI